MFIFRARIWAARLMIFAFSVVAAGGARAATPSSTGLSASPNPSVFGQQVSLVATVTTGAAETPSGTVTFKDGNTTLGTVTLAGGTANLTVNTLTTGAHSLTASYSGGRDLSGSISDPLNFVVNPAATSITLASSSNPSNFGDTVTFTATVSSSAGTPSGSVNFLDGTTLLGSGLLANGAATFSTSSLAGTHAITASYNGAGNFAASVSAPLSQNVGLAQTTTTLASSTGNNSPIFGQQVILTASVSSPAGTPTGSVNFKDGTSLLGSGVLSVGVAVFSTTALSLGSHSISAVYNPAGVFGGSASAILNLSVVQPPLHVFTVGSTPGWQMISSPFTVSQPLADLGLPVYAWQPAANQYAATGTFPADTFHVGQGYWAYVTQDVTIRGPGSPADISRAFNIPLKAGWNQVGNPFAAATALAQMAIQNPDGSIAPVSSQITAVKISPLYPFDTPSNSYRPLTRDSDFLQPWEAGWLYTFTPVALVVAPPTIDHIEIASDSLSFGAGQTLQLTAQAKDSLQNTIPLPASNFQWSSGDTSKATVDAGTGIVRGLAPGQVTITVVELGSNKSASIILTITSRLVSVALTPPTTSLKVGGVTQLMASGVDGAGNPYEILPLNLVWTSSFPGVATVDNNGNVTAVSPGTTTITVTHGPTHVQATAVITVTM